MYETSLKLTEKGYARNLGYLHSGSQPKFLLGRDKDAARKRIASILELWAEIEVEYRQLSDIALGNGNQPASRPTWDEARLAQAKEIAAGRLHVVPLRPLPFETGVEFLRRLTSKENAVPQKPEQVRSIKANLTEQKSQLESLLNPKGLSGITLHEAVKDFRKYIERDCRDADGHLSDNAQNKIKRMGNVLTYIPDCDLALLDWDKLDAIIGFFRSRPKSKRYNRPMSRKYAQHVIGDLKQFFRWLHTSSSRPWKLPADFALIRCDPIRFESEAEGNGPIPTWTIDELIKLNQAATPLERLALYLGLNCAYGADQIGRLRLSHITKTKKGNTVIKRTRHKKRTLAYHLAFPELAAGLEWANQNHPAGTEDLVFISTEGKSFYRKTKGGNRSQKLPNLWKGLIRRVQKGFPEFRYLPLNSLRDTSGNLIRQIADAEIASLHLAHGKQSSDEHLASYSNPRHKAHFQALKKLRTQLLPILTAVDDPWQAPLKQYLSQPTIQKIRRLRQQGFTIRGIAKDTGLAYTTVQRHCKRIKAPK